MKAPFLFKHSRWDALLASLALLQGALLLAAPSFWVVCLGVWWGSNTYSHCFIHKPFFVQPVLNRAFSLLLTAILGIPQTIWKERHLAHHLGARWKLKLSRSIWLELGLVLLVWCAWLCFSPRFFLSLYLPGYICALVLCALHGHYEHHDGTVSHYGRPYNWIFFNDGYHFEHHAKPGLHWRLLSRARAMQQHGAPRASRWPAVLRWLDAFSLDSLERAVLRFPSLQRFLIARHEAALRRLLPEARDLERICIVGGGIFPRTALVLARVAPRARIVIVDKCAAHLENARARLGSSVELVHAAYDEEAHAGFDLVIFPLAYVGDREGLYERPPAPLVLIHDWIWKERERSTIVSYALLKRLALVKQAHATSPTFIESTSGLETRRGTASLGATP